MPISLSELALRTGVTVAGDGAVVVSHVGTLDSAGPGAIAFLANAKYRNQLAVTRASAVIIAPELAGETPLPKLLSAAPYATYAKVAALLHPPPVVAAGTHPAAIVDPRAKVAASASIGPYAVIGDGAVIGERVRIGVGSVVGAGASVGDDAVLHANVTIYDRCVIGPRNILHSGVVIGADGFGMAEEGGRWLKIPQVGRVVTGADVEIGANTTVDRGAIDDTVIEDDVKLDNQIQIGHNCRIGAHTAIAGCTGIAGSTRIGRNCKIGGAAMIDGHIDICDGVVISGAAAVGSSIKVPGVYIAAIPAMPFKQWRQMFSALRRLPGLEARMRNLDAGAAGAPEAVLPQVGEEKG
ncbi:MAG: UDP-3-O-(3-hydroxymyristoyl)glucosamine N-acyltransferase [Betaproteobacteria bacterium]